MRRSTIWLMAAVSLTVAIASAVNPPAVQWTREYPDSVTVYSGRPTADKGYILGGGVHTSQEDGNVLLKVDSLGLKQWEKVFPGTMPYFSCCQTRDGGYAATTKKEGLVVVTKTDSLGNLQWEKVYGDSNPPHTGYSIQQTGDGGYIVGATDAQYAWVIKIDSLGNRQWDRLITENSFDYFGSLIGRTFVPVQETRDKGYILGAVDTGTAPKLIKFDSLGNIQWERNYASLSIGYVPCLQQTSDGGFVLTGTGGFDLYLLKTDSLGNVSWLRLIDGSNHSLDEGIWVEQTSDGGYIVGGNAYLSEDTCEYWVGNECLIGMGMSNGLVIKTDPMGNVVWKKTIDGQEEVYILTECHQTEDGGYIVVEGDVLIKLAPEGGKR